MVKKNYKMIIGVILGLMISSIGVYAVNTLSGNEVSYNNEKSELTSDTVQGAIDELYEKSNEQKSRMPKPGNENIVKVYFYNQERGSDDFCVTGDEATCKVNTCYLNTSKDSCTPGTIIDYNVNEGEKVRFYVVHDDGSTMRLQSQKNIGYDIYYDLTSGINDGINNILSVIENKTSSWNNVNILNYSIGDVNSTLGYSGCTDNNICDTIAYTLSKNKVRARMITVQEVIDLGCEINLGGCPIWVYNYLYNSTGYGGTADDILADYAYFTMSIRTNNSLPYHVRSNASISAHPINHNNDSNIYGARAVVEINKSSG